MATPRSIEAAEAEIRALRAMVTGSNTTRLAGLSTADKTSIIAAINELEAQAGDYSSLLDDHVNSETPHPVYDDGPDLTLLYENAKV